MTTIYLMQARENFDPTNKALVDGGKVNKPPFNQLCNTDNQVVGNAFDFARGKMMYVAFNALSGDGSGGDYFNVSGYTRWDGYFAYPPGAAMTLFANLSPYIGEKDVNTDAVVWYNTYDPTKTVPTTVNPFYGQGSSVYGLVIDSVGSNYTAATVGFSGGGGTGASATVGVGSVSILSAFFPINFSVQTELWAVVPNGQPFLVTSGTVTASAYPYGGGSPSFLDAGGNHFTDIGPVSYTVETVVAMIGNVPTVTIVSFGLASGGVTYNRYLLGSGVYEVDVTQVFGGGIDGVTFTPPSGTGYTSAPAVTITGDGTGATATAYVYQGVTSDGTWRRIGRNYGLSGGNNPVFVNPRNSDVWVHTPSCELYQYRYSDSFAQVISPYIYGTKVTDGGSGEPNVIIFGIDATWTYSLVQTPFTTKTLALVLAPTAITTDEVTADRKLGYATYTAANSVPFLPSTPSPDLAIRTCFGTDGNFYVFSMYPGAGNIMTFRLTQFQPPPFSAYVPGGNVAGGVFTDVTPWSSSTGPNSDGANYVTTTTPNPSWFSYISLYRLPAALNEAVAICKFLKGQSSAGSPTYANTILSAVNLKLGGSPSFDYHSAFVTGYMTAAWATAGSIPVTGYAVLDYRELDIYRDQTDYIYSAKTGVFDGDYSKRWLYFDVYPVVGSTVVTTSGPKVVMVQYQFAYGSAPTVLQVIDEAGWDTTYATYGTAIGKTYVVANSLWEDIPAVGNFGALTIFRDSGITLGTNASPIWWWSGQVDDNLDTAANRVFLLNPAFSARAALNPPTTSSGDLMTALDAPFLRLTFSPASSSGGASQAHVY